MVGKSKRGFFTLIIAGMFGGKTTLLQKLYGDGKDTLAFKPNIDNRYSNEGYLITHRQDKIPAILFANDDVESIITELDKCPKTKKILLDEVMFVPKTLIGVIDTILDRGIDVYAAGLDKTNALKPFGIVPELMEKADKVEHLNAACDGCGEYTATLSYAKFPKYKDVVVAGSEMYGAACTNCHAMLHGEAYKLEESGITLFYPRALTSRERGALRIEVGGDSIRIGKTAAVQIIAEGLGEEGHKVQITLEDLENNPYLTDSYDDTSKTFMLSQEWFAARKYDQVLEQVTRKRKYIKNWDSGDPVHIDIQDVHPEMDWTYSATRLLEGDVTKEQYLTYINVQLDRNWKEISFPDLLVYLRLPRSDVMLRQIKKNLREFETFVPEYFLTMRRLNQRWLAGAQQMYGDNILIVDNLGDFDFANDSRSQAKLVEMVKENLGL